MLGQIAVCDNRVVGFLNEVSSFRNVGAFQRGFGSFSARWTVFEGQDLPVCEPGSEPQKFIPNEEQLAALFGGHPNQRVTAFMSMLAK